MNEPGSYHDPEVARRFLATLRNMNPSPEMQRSIERVEAELNGREPIPPPRPPWWHNPWCWLTVLYLTAATVLFVVLW